MAGPPILWPSLPVREHGRHEFFFYHVLVFVGISGDGRQQFFDVNVHHYPHRERAAPNRSRDGDATTGRDRRTKGSDGRHGQSSGQHRARTKTNGEKKGTAAFGRTAVLPAIANVDPATGKRIASEKSKENEAAALIPTIKMGKHTTNNLRTGNSPLL